MGRGFGGYGEDICIDLVFFMDRIESIEEEFNDG